MTTIRYFADYMAENKLTDYEGEYIAPSVVPIADTNIPDSFVGVLEQNYQELLIEKQHIAEKNIANNKENGYDPNHKDNWEKWAREREQKVLTQFQYFENKDRILNLLNKINGKVKQREGFVLFNNYERELVLYKDRIKSYDEYNIYHAIRIADCISTNYFSTYDLHATISEKIVDSLELRQFSQVVTELGCEEAQLNIAKIYIYCGYTHSSNPIVINSDYIQPFFMENLDFLAEALTLLPCQFEQPNYHHFETAKAIDLLSDSHGIPSEFMPKLLEFAIGINKTNRFQAQKLLARIPNIYQEAINKLSDGKQDVRAVAIDWLAELALTNNQANNQANEQTADIITALYECKKTEKKEVVLAILLTALEKLGEDVNQFMTPEILLTEAEKGLKAKRIKHFEWFNINAIPVMHWQNKERVSPKIIQWWIILAEKLKEPKPNGLLQRYLQLLDDTSQKMLSEFVLQSFISRDVQTYSMELAEKLADTEAPRICSEYHRYNGWFYPNYGLKDTWSNNYDCDITEDVVREAIIKQLLNISHSSAIKNKGMLALIHQSEGSVAVKIVQQYIKNYYKRTAHIVALVTALSASDNPAIIQFLLGISRRYRTKSIQELAITLVNDIAKRNHWTAEELADRTIPTAGLDETGVLTLDYGSRTLTAYVNEKDKLILQNEEGKVIKSLPAPRQNDNDEDKALIKEAKALLSASKKELKQLIPLQTARLHEAMCSERLWTVNEWQTYLFNHPLMKRYVSRLLWLEIALDDTGNHQTVQAFRPCDDGCLLDVSDEEIALNPQHHIKLAHKVLMNDEDCKLWIRHFKEYEIKPLFEQLKNDYPTWQKPHEADEEIDRFNDFYGTVASTYKLRSVMTKLGYQRGLITDGGGFDQYVKAYEALGLGTVLTFSGSSVPEEDIQTDIYEICFVKADSVFSWNTEAIALKDVPPVLLAEGFAEYSSIVKNIR